MKFTILAMRFKTKTLKICLVVLCLLCSSCTLGSPQFNGATFFMKEIKLSQGKVALVDDEDFERINKVKWNARFTKGTWYACRTVWTSKTKGTTIRMHRVILRVTNPKNFVDHKDHDGLNNQKFNLRKCSHQQNSCNRRSNINSTSKYLGVSYCKKRMRWIAQIEKKGKKAWGGVFSDERAAAIAYNTKAIQIHGEFANLNQV